MAELKYKPVVWLILFWIVPAAGSAQTLERLINTLSNNEAFWSVSVRAEDGAVLEDLNAAKLIIPASNQKLYTTAAALDRLGKDYRFTTNIYSNGYLQDSVWVGDLIIKGSGDPAISGTLYNKDREYVFRELLGQLQAKGIKAIDGILKSDISFFDDEVYPPGWDWYDMSFYYAVQINALSFNNNAFDLEVFADGGVGEEPRIDWYPKISSLKIHNNQTIVEPHKKYDEYYRRFLGTNEFDLGSDLPKGYYETESLSVDGADAFFLETFKDFLNRNGVMIKAQADFSLREARSDYRAYTVLAAHTSEPLSVMIDRINKESDNFYAEMVLKTLAAEKQGEPGTFENGITEVRSFLAEQRVDTNFVLMNDGSGLAGGNFTTTGNLTQLLTSMQHHKQFDTYYNSLPIAAKDGSLAHRFRTSLLAENLRAKTGFVGGVRTLSGYFTAKSGKKVAFSIATNHFKGKTGAVDASHQKILEYLYCKY